jgi:hypothetical protein
MKSRESGLRAKRFEVAEKARKASDLESMISEFENVAVDLERQIAAEEDRTGVKDRAHFSYSTFAKAVATRRDNLLASAEDLRLRLEVARREHEEALDELHRMESAEPRDTDRTIRSGRLKTERSVASH